MDVLESSKKYYLDVNLEEAETSIRASLKDAARSVIAVGHYLKVIRDKELYREAGYENVWDYAADTFGFSKSTASRYMARNDKFSVGGNSPVLAEEFREYSKAQLQEMLSLDEAQLENVTPDMTVKQIRELKKPKELPCFEIDGQMEIQDILKADQEGQKKDPETEEKLSAYGLPKRAYPDGVTRKIEGCEGDTGKGYNCLECHLECEIGEEYCMCVDAIPCEMVRTGRWEDLKEHVGKSCQFVNLDLVKYEYGSVVPVPCCKKCQNPCAFACTVSGKRVAASQQPAAADAPQETTGTAAEKQPEDNVATSQQNAKQDSPTIREFIKFWKEILPEEFRRAMRAMREGNSTKEKAQQIQKIMRCFALDAKIVSRKKSFVVYLKEGAQIVDVLNVMEAHQSLMELENIRILKDMRNTVNRKVNCETANINKTVNAAVRQVEDIQLISRTIGFESLSDGLAQIARLRLQYPDATLKELGMMLNPQVGKSGVNHRLRKLSEIADELRENKEELL